ncbi:helix-turn-helix domain-containing protein [Nocardia yamanashiensis]|uniref:helix-turn-helix domain-containing protein n=1 Tax=Nocardia yamanashiensis TaxID=209247 RepID=UPI001E3D5286|nr:helix-turn-helix transcriptional regulator [Nocardia yamanashiensis]UGT43652.1 helix-turn-helix domain-containing protein [Nocardia yamanashiensis]
MIDDSSGVGERVAEARKLKGWTQSRLAMETGLSKALISAVEQGRRAATPAYVSACAKALRTSVPELLGQPYAPTTTEDREIHAAIALLRNELAAWDMDAPDVTVRPLPAFSIEVLQTRKYRRDAASPKLAAILPPLLTEARALVHRSIGHDRNRAFVLLAELYYNARSLAHKLGYQDLAALSVDRMTWAANESGDHLWIAAAQFHRATLLTNGGDWKTALAFLERCRTQIEDRLGLGAEPDLIAWGGLHLQSGLAAARAGSRDMADAHLAEAVETVNRIGHDRDQVLVFGPTNVGIWSVALSVEMMDAAEALARAQQLVIPADTPKSRSGHHYIDVARAHLLHGNKSLVLPTLLTAKSIAPSMVRWHPMVHETIRVLAREEARTSESVRSFAAWCGIRS